MSLLEQFGRKISCCSAGVLLVKFDDFLFKYKLFFFYGLLEMSPSAATGKSANTLDKNLINVLDYIFICKLFHESITSTTLFRCQSKLYQKLKFFVYTQKIMKKAFTWRFNTCSRISKKQMKSQRIVLEISNCEYIHQVIFNNQNYFNNDTRKEREY